jgi:hypothetical protein
VTPGTTTRAATGFALTIALALIGGVQAATPERPAESSQESLARVDCDTVDADTVHHLAGGPAPRVLLLQGSVALVSMEPFARFLIAMGYPAAALRDPDDGSMSRSSFTDSRKLAGIIAWHYERDAMMPMLIGHSQGGMLAIRVLYDLAGEFGPSIEVWDPEHNQGTGRDWIRDPYSGEQRPVVGLQLPYVAALATGKLPRVLLGQWSMLGRLRGIPDSVEEFTGFLIRWDPIAGTFPGSEPYRALGSASVRTIELPAATSHIGLPDVAWIATDPRTRDWVDRYRPGQDVPADVADDARVGSLLMAADVWHSVRRHWCLEAQRHARWQTHAAPAAGAGAGR